MKMKRLVLLGAVLAGGMAMAAEPGKPRLSVFHNHVADMAKAKEISIPEAVKRVKALGIEGVEVFDAFDRGEAAEIVAAGLVPSAFIMSADFAYSDETQKVERAFAFIAAHPECRRIMLVPGYAREGDDRAALWEAMKPRIARLLDRARKANVAVELEDFDSDRAIVGSAADLRRAFKAFPDLGHVYDTGNYDYFREDALAALDEFRPRIGHVHVKDIAKEGPRRAVPAGTGRMPIGEMVRRLVASGYSNWLTIECFGSDDIGRDIAVSAAYLRSLLAP